MNRKPVEVYGGGCTNFPGKGTVPDIDVANMVRKHTRVIDRLNVEGMVAFAFYAQDILIGAIEEPKGNWFFKYKKH